MATLETTRRWRDRRKAGQELVTTLQAIGKEWLDTNSMVVALPRGGVAVGHEVAMGLGVPMTTWSVRKLARARAPEIAIGAIAAGGIEVWDSSSGAIPMQECQQLLAKETQELNRRRQCFEDGPVERLRGKNLIVVDDGIATGMTVMAALHSLQEVKPKQLILAVPVVDQKLIRPLQQLCDQLISLKIVPHLRAVGDYFENFEQLDDREVIRLLKDANRAIHRSA
jgi:putative phosphoribosyl transferase